MQLLKQKSSLNNYKDYLKSVKYRDVGHYFSKQYLNNHTQKAYPNNPNNNLEERNQINYNLINNSNHYLMNNKASNEEVVNYNKPFAKIHGDNSEFIQ